MHSVMVKWAFLSGKPHSKSIVSYAQLTIPDQVKLLAWTQRKKKKRKNAYMCVLIHVLNALCKGLHNLNNPEHADICYNFRITNDRS